VTRELSSGGAAGPHHAAHRGHAGHAALRRSGPRSVRLACPLPSRAASGSWSPGVPSLWWLRAERRAPEPRARSDQIEARPPGGGLTPIDVRRRPRGQNPSLLPLRLHASRAVRGLGPWLRIPPTAPAPLGLYSPRPWALTQSPVVPVLRDCLALKPSPSEHWAVAAGDFVRRESAARVG
jgi:hypothetical protein